MRRVSDPPRRVGDASHGDVRQKRRTAFFLQPKSVTQDDVDQLTVSMRLIPAIAAGIDNLLCDRRLGLRANSIPVPGLAPQANLRHLFSAG